MKLIVNDDETILEAISRKIDRLSIELNDTYDYLLIGDDQEGVMLNQEQVMELVEELTELASQMKEEE